MATVASDKNEPKTHGLGIVAKKPGKGFRRGNMLSRDLAFFNGKAIAIRMINKTLLTSSKRSQNISTDECHYLASMSLSSGATTPLSRAVSRQRLKMVSNFPNIDE